MKRLIELANKIKEEKLRRSTVELLKNLKLSHPDFQKYPKEDIEKVRTPFTVSGVTVERDLLRHTVAVAEACMNLAEVVEKNYKLKVKRDYLLAGALLHDVMKAFEWKNGKPTGMLLDHLSLGIAELYARKFPEEVIHIVASHFGDAVIQPKTVEATILHYVDTLLSLVEFYTGKPVQQPLIILDEETMRKLSEKSA